MSAQRPPAENRLKRLEVCSLKVHEAIVSLRRTLRESKMARAKLGAVRIRASRR